MDLPGPRRLEHQQEGDAVLNEGRHVSGPSFVPASDGKYTTPDGKVIFGVDMGMEGERSGYVVMRKEKGSVTLLGKGRIHRLHEYDSVAADDLCDEQIYELRTGSYTPHRLGPSFAHRYIADGLKGLVRGAPLWHAEGISSIDLAQCMGPRNEERGATRGLWPGGRVMKSIVTPTAEGKIVGGLIHDRADDYLIFADTAFRQPTLFRYVASGIDAGKPVLYCKGDGSDSIHVGSAFCFYPAETVPCATCEETGEVTQKGKDSGAVAPSTPIGFGCPSCLGLTRIWKAAPFRMPEARSTSVFTFADANPKKWRATGSF